MSLVGKVGRRRFRARFAMAMVYLLLVLGAVTTVYPFLLMFTTGLKGPTDQNDNRLAPLYLRDDQELLKKVLDDKYGGNASLIASTRIGAEASPQTVAAYRRFLAQLPNDSWTTGYRVAPNQVTSRLMIRYDNWLRDRYRGDIGALNKAYIEENVDFQTIFPPPELFDRKDWKPVQGRKWDEWQTFKRSLPVEFRIPVRTQRLWQEFLRARYQNRFESVPRTVAGSAKVFEEIDLPRGGLLVGVDLRSIDIRTTAKDKLWSDFVTSSLPAKARKAPVEAQWLLFVTREQVKNTPPRPGVDSDDVFPDVPDNHWAAEVVPGMNPLPIAAEEAQWVRDHAGEIRREFAGRNYGYVLDYILLHGRAVWNTLAFCLLAILTQLVVNPLAAYALSRYPIRASGKILLFLLATMAFPAEVAMIPSFLLLKGLGLLNTFAALVLPGAASGYMIFLLKGFFDSLPQELFEAGSIDGAKETTMLARIALPLSKPVLGYLALLAFMGAYGAFIYAFLIAQDQRMWTLMVFVYQLQNVAPRSVTMAALTLAALPTLLVFLFAQRVIMRGIVLPGEK